MITKLEHVQVLSFQIAPVPMNFQLWKEMRFFITKRRRCKSSHQAMNEEQETGQGVLSWRWFPHYTASKAPHPIWLVSRTISGASCWTNHTIREWCWVLSKSTAKMRSKEWEQLFITKTRSVWHSELDLYPTSSPTHSRNSRNLVESNSQGSRIETMQEAIRAHFWEKRI